ncbi:hypothetical protein V2G26_001327 [Clonostachys chloroleuca]
MLKANLNAFLSTRERAGMSYVEGPNAAGNRAIKLKMYPLELDAEENSACAGALGRGAPLGQLDSQCRCIAFSVFLIYLRKGWRNGNGRAGRTETRQGNHRNPCRQPTYTHALAS